MIIAAVQQRNLRLIESLNQQHIAQLDAELLAFVQLEQESAGSASAERDEEPADDSRDWTADGLLVGGRHTQLYAL